MSTSLKPFMNSEHCIPQWLCDYLEISIPCEGDEVDLAGHNFIRHKGILRSQAILSVEREVIEDAGITIIARKEV